ncbi:MAG TPA: tetratricopeptide repeat protein [bacterium]|nr:tetratricopeptide repeat protein [bacterium]
MKKMKIMALIVALSFVFNVAYADDGPSANQMPIEDFLKSNAVHLFKSGKYDKALPEFRALSQQYPEDPLLYRYIGMTLTAMGNLNEAVDAFDIALKLDPENPSTHYFYARTLYAKGDAANAQKQLDEVLRLDFEGYYGNAAKRAMPLIRAFQFVPKPKRWSIFGSTGYEYDSNVTLKPNDKSIANSSDESAGRYYFNLGGFYNIIQGEKFNSWVGYKVYQSLHDDSLNEFNFTNQEFWIYNEYITTHWGKEFIYSFRYGLPWGFLDGNMFSIANDFLLSVKARLTKNTQTEIFTRYAYWAFGPDGFDPGLTSRDGNYTTQGIVHTWYFSNFRRSVFAGYFLDTASTRGNNFDRTGHTAQVGFRTPLCDKTPILRNTTVEVIGEFTAANYYHYSNFVYFPETKSRLNNDWSLWVALTYPITKHLSIQGYYKYINANNQNDIFQYDRHIGGTALLFQY